MKKVFLIIGIVFVVLLVACEKEQDKAHPQFVAEGSMLLNAGEVYEWGFKEEVRNGQGKMTISLIKLTEIFNLEAKDEIIQIEQGGDHRVALSSKGRVFSEGKNNFGQLGDGTNASKSFLEITSQFQLGDNDQIIQIASGFRHNLALSKNGRLFAWGYNGYGQLGNATKDHKNVPTEINIDLAQDDKIIAIDAGQNSSILLTEKGRVYQFGLVNVTENTTPTNITNRFALRDKEKITRIIAGANHNIALTSENRILTWGENALYQLGDGSNINRNEPIDITNKFNLKKGEVITKVQASLHTVVLTSKGRVFAWGINMYGEVGDGTRQAKAEPIEITNRFVLENDDQIIDFCVGSSHTKAVSKKGKYFAWGANSDFQLIDGTNENRLLPTQITIDLSQAITREEFLAE